MRCADCDTEPLSPRYCECCGREITVHLAAADAAPVVDDPVEDPESASGPDDWAPNPNPTADLRYQASPASSTISETNPATASNEVTTSTSDQPKEKTVSAASKTSTATSQESPDSRTAAKSDRARPEATAPSEKHEAVVASAKAAGGEAEPAREASPKRQKTDSSQVETTRKPATRRPIVPENVPVSAERQEHATKVAIGALVIGALVVGAPWLRTHRAPVVESLKQYVSVAKDSVTQVADAGNQSAPIEAPATVPVVATPDRAPALPKERPAVPAAPTPERKSAAAAVPKSAATAVPKSAATAGPAASTPIRPKPATPVRQPRPAPAKVVVSKPVRAKEPAREVPAAPVLAARPAAPVVAAPVVDVVAAAPAPAPAAAVAAVGPFFESNQVNESPRVVTRWEPRLPEELRDRPIKEVVVVRALVSQSGHPSRVSLLRKSKAGPQLDDVVVAAVNQWRFSPAKKKGEAVSCWFNFAVPIGQ